MSQKVVMECAYRYSMYWKLSSFHMNFIRKTKVYSCLCNGCIPSDMVCTLSAYILALNRDNAWSCHVKQSSSMQVMQSKLLGCAAFHWCKLEY